MKFLYTAFFILAFSALGLCQRIASASVESDFKTVKNGFVESVFSFNQALTEAEKNEIISWAKANEPDMFISVSADNTALTLKLSPTFNERTLYHKTFAQLNISEVTVTSNNTQNTLGLEAFFEQFGL